MDDNKIFAQIVEDFRQHSSGESLLRAQLAARIGELEGELSAWGNLGFDFERRIRLFKLVVAEYKRGLQQIAQSPDASGNYALSRAECEQIAKNALQQGDAYEKETQAE